MPSLRVLLFAIPFAGFALNALAQPVPRGNPLHLPAPAQTEGSGAEEESVQLGLAPEETANLQKRFTLEGFFAGDTVGRGTIRSKTIGAARTYNIRTSGTWDGEVLTVVETYQYSFGAPEQRVWRFTKTGPDTYLAESDEIKEKTEIVLNGQGSKMKYRKQFPKPSGDGTVSVTQRENWSFDKRGMLSMETTLWKFVIVGKEVINLVRVGNEAALKPPKIGS